MADDFDDFLVDDTDFPCTASGVGGVLVPEIVDIVQICQDPDDLGIIYLDVSVQGVYLYNPKVEITWTGSTAPVNIDAHFIPNYKGSGLAGFPIDPNCGMITVTMAYKVSKVIPDFDSVSDITFRVQMFGDPAGISTNPIVTGIFTSIDPKDTDTFVKGLNPQPYKIYFDPTSGKIKVQYLNLGTKPCQCAINCVSPDEDDFNLTVCEDEIQEITVDATSIVGDPTLVSFTFQDSLGNQTTTDIEALVNVKPAKLQVIPYKNPNRMGVGLNFITAKGTKLTQSKLQYQIWKFEANPDNAKIWRDWSSQPWTTFHDKDVIPGQRYGYAVRFKGEFDEVSFFSDWNHVMIPL